MVIVVCAAVTNSLKNLLICKGEGPVLCGVLGFDSNEGLSSCFVEGSTVPTSPLFGASNLTSG